MRAIDTVKLTVKLKGIVVNIDNGNIRSMSESSIQFYQILLGPIYELKGLASHASVAIAKGTSGRIAETRICILERMTKSHLNGLYKNFKQHFICRSWKQHSRWGRKKYDPL